MPAFIGAGSFKGYWNATTNSGSASDMAPPLSGSTPAGAGGLFANSGSNGGYNGNIGLTASVGDYWQVNNAGSYSVDGESNWAINDWCIYQSSSAGFVWTRLSVTDTVAATIIGNASTAGLKNDLLASASADSGPAGGAPGANAQVLFCSSSLGSDGSDKYIQGNTRFTWNETGAILNLTGTLKVSGTIEASTLHTVEVTSSVLFEDGDTRFGNSADDQHQFSGSVYVQQGLTASFFTGDGRYLTNVTAGSALGNSGYGNPGTSRVPFFGVIDGDSNYGLSGSANLNFFTASNELQVTGNIRATNFYAADKIYHEGDADTYIDFNAADQIHLRAGGITMAKLVEGSEDYLELGVAPGGTNNVDVRMNGSTLWVDGTSANVGIRCAPSGTIQALTVSGSTLFGSASASTHRFTGSMYVQGSIYTAQDIIRWDDADTKISFTNDQIDFTAGGTTLLSLDEDSQNLVQIGDGTDVDLKVRSLNDDFAIFVEGDSDKVGIGTSNPLQKLSVSGSTVFGTAGGSDTHWFTGSIYASDDIHIQDKIYGLGDLDTYIDFNTDEILLAAGNVAMVHLVEGSADYLELGKAPGGTDDIDIRMNVNTLWVDGASDNVGIRCAPSGTIQALTVSGSTLFGSASANSHQFTGSVYVSNNLAFAGNLHNAADDDTYIDFLTDRMRFFAGNIQFADFLESATGQDAITFNGNSSDVDLIIKSDPGGGTATTAHSHTIFVEASSARVGIATSSPGSQLDVSGSTILGRHDGDTVSYHQVSGTLEVTGNIGLNTPATDYSLTLPNLDSLVGRGMAYAWSTYSSARFKENVLTMNDPIETAKKLRGVEFTWKNSGNKDFGFIAEEVGKVLPQVVAYEPDGETATGMDYSKITSLLVECVKVQQTQLETQEKRIKTLEKKLKS